MKRFAFSLLLSAVLPLFASAQTFDIHLDKPGAAIQPTMYGIFFEDINFAADGGLYAELVKNRSFEYLSNPLQGWKAFGKVQVRDDGPFERCSHYVRLTEPGHPHKVTGLENEGYFGIGLREGDKVYVKVVNTSEKQQNLVLNFGGKNVKAVTSILFSSDNLYKDNTLDEPDMIIPREMAFQGEGSNVDVAVNPLSFAIFIRQIK